MGFSQISNLIFRNIEKQCCNKRVVIYGIREQDDGSIPSISTIFLFMSSHCNICSEKCFGIENNDGSCCSIEDRDFIIGPHNDTEKFITNLSIKLGREVKHSEVFIDYEEGSKLFPTRMNWQLAGNYPALRVNLHHPKKHCIFYNPTLKYCTVYDIRPKTCEDYECWYLIENKPKT